MLLESVKHTLPKNAKTAITNICHMQVPIPFQYCHNAAFQTDAKGVRKGLDTVQWFILLITEELQSFTLPYPSSGDMNDILYLTITHNSH